MNRLAILRIRLQSLRLARWAVRQAAALALLLTALLAGWMLAGWLDWSLNLSLPLRAILLVAWGTGLAAFFHRWIWPELAVTESLEDVALVVEQEHGIDSDLIAALQFDGRQAPAWGSSRLSSAVIEYVAEFSQTLDVYRGFRWGRLPRRGGFAGCLLAASALWMLFWPAHVSAFWNRFWLGAARYPTKTRIVELLVNGRTVPVFHHQPERLSIPQDQPLNLTVHLAGDIDVPVTAAVLGQTSREQTAWNLTPDEDSDGRFKFVAPIVAESSRISVRAGDAEADPIDLQLIPLPVVDVLWTAEPPAYALGGPLASVPAGARQFAALQGSQLDLIVRSMNKPLRSVTLRLPDGTIPLQPEQGTGHLTWKLPPSAPLREFREALRYELEVIDVDGLSPPAPITGEIRLQADRLPRVAAAVVSHRVLPTAAPKITYGATDDFGVKAVRWQIEIVRATGEPQLRDQTVWTAAADQRERTVRGDGVLDLAPWRLAKGDEVRVTVIADDDRGAFPPQSGSSETLVFDVTDRNGILESLLEIDQQSAKHLDDIIERELGIGRTPR